LFGLKVVVDVLGEELAPGVRHLRVRPLEGLEAVVLEFGASQKGLGGPADGGLGRLEHPQKDGEAHEAKDEDQEVRGVAVALGHLRAGLQGVRYAKRRRRGGRLALGLQGLDREVRGFVDHRVLKAALAQGDAELVEWLLLAQPPLDVGHSLLQGLHDNFLMVTLYMFY